MHRSAARQAFDPSGQRIDYNRLKRERAREGTHQPTNSIPPELIEYAYPFHHQSKANHGTISRHVPFVPLLTIEQMTEVAFVLPATRNEIFLARLVKLICS